MYKKIAISGSAERTASESLRALEARFEKLSAVTVHWMGSTSAYFLIGRFSLTFLLITFDLLR